MNVYSVTKISEYIASLFSQEGIFRNVCVKGEIGTMNRWDHGIIFLNLKEGDCVLPCMLTSHCVASAPFEIKNGMMVTVVGNIVANSKKGSYKLNATQILKDEDLGDSQKNLLKLMEELKEEGLFDPQYKLPIPKTIKTLGFVTSQTGAVINDVINVTFRRNPYIQIVLCPSKVSGEDAVPGIVDGIRRLEEYGADVIIVGRGGGSDEELWVYNNRAIAEAVFGCSVPVISAVGHDIHYTILDLVADARAATPSQAAEMAVFDYYEMRERLEGYEESLRVLMKGKIRLQRSLLDAFAQKLKGKSPQNRLLRDRQRLLHAEERLKSGMDRKVTLKRHTLSLYIEKLKGLSPLDKLNQGYAYVSANGRTLQSIDDVNTGDITRIFVKDGMLVASVTAKERMDYT